MTKPDKRNDGDWCMQFFAPVYGVAFLLVGLWRIGRPPFDSVSYWFISLGFFWLAMGFVHRARWRKKRRAFDPQQGSQLGGNVSGRGHE